MVHAEKPRRYDQLIGKKDLLNIEVPDEERTPSLLKFSYFFGRSFMNLTPDRRAEFIGNLGDSWNGSTQTMILSRRTIELLFEVIREVYRTRRAVAVAA